MTEARDIDFGFEVSKGVLAQFAMAAIGFAGVVLFARILGPVEFGGFYLLMTLVKIGNRPVVGLAIGVKKRLSEPNAQRNQLLGVLISGAGASVVLAAAVAVSVPWAFRSYTDLQNAHWLFLAMFAPLVVFASLQQALDSTARVGTTRWIDAGRSLLTFPAQLGLVLIGSGATGMAFGESAATLLVIPITAYAIGIRPTIPDRESLQSVWRFAKYSIPTRLLARAYEEFDMVLIGVLLSSAVAADYQVALKLTLPAVFVSSVAGAGLMSRVSNMQGDESAIVREISNTTAFASVLAIPIFFGAIAIPNALIVTTYGGEYTDAAPLLVGLALYRLIRTQGTAYMQGLSGLDRQDRKMRLAAVTLAFNIVVGIALAFEIGVLGIVIATVLSEGFRYLIGMYLVRRMMPTVDIFPTVLRDQLLAGLVMFVVVEGVHTVLLIKSWLQLVVLVGFGAIVYFAILVVLSDHFRQTAESIFGSVRKRLAAIRF